MKDLHCSCQGESHKATNKVCQDYSYSEISDRLAIAIVCDGHGGKRYFRSDVGAKYATEITRECVTTFIDGVGDELFKGAPFTQVSALDTEVQNDNFAKKTKVDAAMRQLFSAIIYRWREKILQHAENTPLTDAERETLEAKYIVDFEHKESLEKTYGCTLMCYAQTTDFWFAFHVGDGKCIAFDQEGNWSEPIPWDDRCFLNKTTSLCDTSALDEFRYCYQGNNTFPVAIFLGSDGIDDSFGETTNMVNFYAQVAKMFVSDGHEESKLTLESTLPELSAKGSQDDMSIACIYDDLLLKNTVRNIILWQRNNVLNAITTLNQKLEQILSKYNQFEGKRLFSPKEKIDMQYTVTELKRTYQMKRDQAKKYDRFSQELGEEYEPYNDELGFGEQLVLVAEQRLDEQTSDAPITTEENADAVEQIESKSSEITTKDTDVDGTENNIGNPSTVDSERNDVETEDTCPEMSDGNNNDAPTTQSEDISQSCDETNNEETENTQDIAEDSTKDNS